MGMGRMDAGKARVDKQTPIDSLRVKTCLFDEMGKSLWRFALLLFALSISDPGTIIRGANEFYAAGFNSGFYVKQCLGPAFRNSVRRLETVFQPKQFAYVTRGIANTSPRSLALSAAARRVNRTIFASPNRVRSVAKSATNIPCQSAPSSRTAPLRR